MDEEFGAWYQALYPNVLTTLSAAIREPSVAEEAAQEAFTRALERWPKVQAMRSPDGWVYTVALNAARRSLKQRGIRHLDAEAEHRLSEGPIERDPDLVRALGQLGERARLAVCLRYIGDLKERDVAEIMGLRPGTVARTLHEARLKLAGILADQAPKEPGRGAPSHEQEDDHAS